MVSTTASACAIPVRVGVGVGVRVRIRVRIGVRVRVGVRGRVRVRVRVSLSLRDPGGRELRRADEVAGSVHTGGTCHEVRPHRDVAVGCDLDPEGLKADALGYGAPARGRQHEVRLQR